MAITKPKINPQFADIVIDKPNKVKLAKHSADYKVKEVKKQVRKKRIVLPVKFWSKAVRF